MPRTPSWIKGGIEPSVADLLSDPIVQALMRADGVRGTDVLAAIRLATRHHHPIASVVGIRDVPPSSRRLADGGELRPLRIPAG